MPSLLRSFEVSYLRKWSLISILIGVIAGFGAILFYEGLQLGTHYFLGHGAGLYPPDSGGTLEDTVVWTPPTRLWLLPAIVALGGLVSGVLVFTFAPEAEGHGTDAAIRAFHREKGVIRKRIPLVKMVASILTISTGGSAGREGPIAQIAAGFGSFVGSLFRLSAHDRRIAVTVGIGAGVGSIFKAPLGGALLSTEILYMRDFEKEALIPAVIASIVGYSIFALYDGFDPVFSAGEYHWTMLQIPFFVLLGVVCGLIGQLYVFAFYRTREIFSLLKVPNHVKPALGGVLVGSLAVVLVLLFPEEGGAAGLGGLGMGYGFIQLAIYNHLPIKIMLILIFAKIVTSITIGSGGSGGVFAPGLVIGAMVGGTVGAVSHLLFPSIVPYQTIPAFVIIGMMALFGGVAKAPIAVIVMVSEMTNDFTLLLPSMTAIVGSVILTGERSIYHEQVPTRLDSPAHMREYFCSLLSIPKVQDATRTEFKRLSPDSSISEAVLAMRHGVDALPVVRGDSLVGSVSLKDATDVPIEKWKDTKVGEIIKEPPVIYHNSSLFEAIEKMNEMDLHTFFVVDREDPKRLVGLVTRKDILRIYSGGIE
ncbi:MAG: chloride channel protein [Euryarchaeota archaeon]|nr:chloride channel protein [Euryarchaeota archaeon]